MDTVVKESIFSKWEKLTFAALAALFLFFLTNYVVWWFQVEHIPNNWANSRLHLLDFAIFSVLSFIVFIGAFLNVGSLFAVWHAAKPKHLEPQAGLKVAFLTCFVPEKEPLDMLVDTLISMKNVTYAHDTWVLDEGSSWEVKDICQKLDVKYFTRFGIAGYNQDKDRFRAKTKAGNHNAWADGYAKFYDIVAQIDVDNTPKPNYFERTLGYFRDPKVGFVGMPQVYKNTDNWIARGAAEQAYFFHGPMQKGFYGCDMPFLIGTSHIYRTSAMEQIGGYAPTIVEDHLTGMNFYAHGFKGVFVPEILAVGEGPFNWLDYFNQQMRWSYGLFEIFFKNTPRIVHKLKWKQKINYFISQHYYFTGVAVILGMFLTFLYLIYGVRAASMNLLEWIRLAAPPFMLATTIQLYSHRFSIDPKHEPVFGLLGMFMNFGAKIIYALAFIKFVSGQKLKYMVTQKGITGQRQRVPLSTFALHIILAVIMLFAFVQSFLTNHAAIQLRFWALFNAVTLGSVALSAYHENFARFYSLIRLDLRPVRYALSSTMVLLIFTGIMFGYPKYEGAVKAFFVEKQTTVVEEQPISGKINPRENGAYLGVSLYQHNDTDYLNNLEQNVNKKFAIVGYYQAWTGENNKFDKVWASNISKNGSIPLVTWEPWQPVSGFDRLEPAVDQQDFRLKNIIDGKYDAYIEEYAQEIKSYKKPVMVRFAHEMNGNWYPWGSTFNEPQDYILASRHVHEIFDRVGASNVTWVWSPNEAYFEKRVPYAHLPELFYPGDDYVDWVGLSSFNWAGTYKNNSWRTPQNLYDFTLTKLRAFNKPIIITETASAEQKNNDTFKGEWIRQLAQYVESNPDIKGVVWFDTQDNGVNWTINSSENSRNAFQDSFGSYFFQAD